MHKLDSLSLQRWKLRPQFSRLLKTGDRQAWLIQCFSLWVKDSFCCVTRVLNSGLHTYKAGALPLELPLQSILLWLFWRWLSWTLCWSWPPTMTLWISASQVARITGVSHWSPGRTHLWCQKTSPTPFLILLYLLIKHKMYMKTLPLIQNLI
jgi:hypothetical protein